MLDSRTIDPDLRRIVRRALRSSEGSLTHYVHRLLEEERSGGAILSADAIDRVCDEMRRDLAALPGSAPGWGPPAAPARRPLTTQPPIHTIRRLPPR